MKKYNNLFLCYGQSTVGRINYYQKMGVAEGIIKMLKHEMRNRGLALNNLQRTETINGVLVTSTRLVIVSIPADEEDWLEVKCPIFVYNGKAGLIDMLSFGDELMFHIRLYNGKTNSYEDGHWHTIRECFTLEQTCTLFEYVEDVIKEITVLPPGESRHK